MAAIPLDLNGYTDLPPGRIANVVTYFEMRERPSGESLAALPDGYRVRHAERPALTEYRDLYRRIGHDWLWFSRAIMPDHELAELLARPTTEIYYLERGDAPVGLVEIHRGEVAGEV